MAVISKQAQEGRGWGAWWRKVLGASQPKTKPAPLALPTSALMNAAGYSYKDQRDVAEMWDTLPRWTQNMLLRQLHELADMRQELGER